VRIPLTPAAAKAANHTNMTGPNSLPTTPVPKRWITNNTVNTVNVIGNTSCPNPGTATLTPSTADNTEMAGVMMPSP